MFQMNLYIAYAKQNVQILKNLPALHKNLLHNSSIDLLLPAHEYVWASLTKFADVDVLLQFVL